MPYREDFPFPRNPNKSYTIGTLQADKTRIAIEETMSVAGFNDTISESQWECIHHESGTSTCKQLVVIKDPGTTTTIADVTYTGTPVPFLTITNVAPDTTTTTRDSEQQDDGGGACGLSSSVFAGVAALGIGATLII